ncbi:MAG: hypothetical protein JWQ59_772, partial [Cryobacterium sp.]|nr:hypothetical protein [Cryobacterium sp.]
QSTPFNDQVVREEGKGETGEEGGQE